MGFGPEKEWEGVRWSGRLGPGVTRLRGPFLAYALVIVLGGLAYAVWHIVQNYRDTIAVTHGQLLTVATALQGELEAMLGDGMGAAEASHNHFMTREPKDTSRLTALLREDLTGSDYVKALFVAVPGMLILVERDGTVTQAAEYPPWLKCPGHSELCVAEPINGNTLLPIIKRIATPSGEHLIGALYGLREMQKFYRRLDIPDAIISVSTPDGLLLARTREIDSDSTPQIEPRSVRDGDLYRRIASVGLNDGRAHIAEGISQYSGELLISAVARIPGVPLMVAVSRPKQSILAPWLSSTRLIAGIAAGGTLLSLFVTGLLYRFISAIDEREQQLVRLFETARFGMMLLQNGHVKYVNQMTNLIFRVPRGQTMIGKFPWDYSPAFQPSAKSSKEEAQAKISAWENDGSAPTSFRWVHQRMDGETFEAEVGLSNIKLGEHDVTLAIIHDLSALMKAQDDLRKLNETLEQRVKDRTEKLQEANNRFATINAELEEFTASASHDLRSPLGTISGQASLITRALGDRANEPDVAARFEKIQMAVRRASDVIDGLLSLARVTRQDILFEPICLSDIARQIFEDLKDSQPRRNVEFVCEEGIYVNADPRLMKSLIQNLISNAWKYSEESDCARIEFGRKKEGDTFSYFVRDNGAGFNMEYAGLLFQAFKRLHSHDQFTGTGVGLATAARIVKRYNGRIWAVSEEGKGATFCFTLPRAEVDHYASI